MALATAFPARFAPLDAAGTTLGTALLFVFFASAVCFLCLPLPSPVLLRRLIVVPIAAHLFVVRWALAQGAAGTGLGATLVGAGPPLLLYLSVLYAVHLTVSALAAAGSVLGRWSFQIIFLSERLLCYVWRRWCWG